MNASEDWHFLIDNASPREVELILRCLDQRLAVDIAAIRSRLLLDWGFTAQRSMSFSTRRLCDLGLASRLAEAPPSSQYVLTPLGAKVRGVLESDRDLYLELMHFLHYDSYEASTIGRKLLLSYRWLCDAVWEGKQVYDAAQLAGMVQSRIAQEFPAACGEVEGGRFNKGGVSGWKPWLSNMSVSPFGITGRTVVPRTVERFELALLSLDHVYRARGYRFGDPVVLDENLLDECARVFFLDHDCWRSLISLASKVTGRVTMRDTFAGTAVTLIDSYGILDV